MYGKKIVLILATAALAAAAPAHEFNGTRAMEYARRVVAFGARPPGSPALQRLRAYILAQLRAHHCEVSEDRFTAQTPVGAVAMSNIIARFKGTSGRAIVLTGHYDTKSMPGANFVGADDGGSSTAFLLEMAAALDGQPRRDDVYLVWFDGEEAFVKWTDSDSLYGSRHLADRWAQDGTIGRIKALINVDMIGDKSLDIMPEENSSAGLRRMVWETANRLGYGKYFLEQGGATEDDHIPFVKMGVNALDLIDFDKTYWHTPEDTIDKLAPHSFEVVGAVLSAVIHQLERTS